jgi:tetratricopeptide (TPR) repeat protein
MKKIALLLCTLAGVLYLIYAKNQSPVVQSTDFEKYLNPDYLNKKKSDLESSTHFWEQKLSLSPDNTVYQRKLAGLHAAQFKLSGNPKHLATTDSLLEIVHEHHPNDPGVLHALAANAITQHAFQRADKYTDAAYQLGEKHFASSLLRVDVLLERGQLYSANRILQSIRSDHHFDYLIRCVKYQDQIGDLPKAIELMEEASQKAIESGNPGKCNWALSNLADMYGHDGQIRKSYQTYLRALENDPADMHALKGIAWIAFSHDQNTEEAKRILQFLQTVHPIPDYELLLAEIAAFENDSVAQKDHEAKFLSRAGLPMYGNMYKKYICELQSSSPESIDIARAEIQERPHPLSYDLLAWTSFQNGETKQALDLVETHVLNQTEEPTALLHSGLILKANGQQQKARKYLLAALESEFELGPVAADEIRTQLTN